VATDMMVRSPSLRWAVTLGLKLRRVNGAAVLLYQLYAYTYFVKRYLDSQNARWVVTRVRPAALLRSRIRRWFRHLVARLCAPVVMG
jgi:hypothetical protein